MKIFMWYLFVVIAAVLLILSVLYHNIYMAVPCFVIAIILNKYIDDIPMPKQFEKLKIMHRK